MTGIDDFLADTEAREIDWVRPAGAPSTLTTHTVLIGNGGDALEVALASAHTQPRMDDVRRLWSLRWGRRAAPVLLVVAYPNTHGGTEATVCGPTEDSPALANLDLSQVERVAAAGLAEQDAASSKRTLARLLAGPKDQLVTGLLNSGLFASHELRHGVPNRADWQAAQQVSQPLLGKSGLDLIRSLGYTTTAHGSIAQVLGTPNQRHALAVLLNEDETFERPGLRFGSVSPVTLGLAIAQEQNLDWLIVLRGTQIRLYPTKPDTGVGRKGQAETFVELDLAALPDSDAGYVSLLFSPAALADGGTVAEILNASVDHAAALGARLRERVYVDVVPALAVAVANSMKATKGADLDDADLDEAYHRTLLILFRLLFVSYAEDRGLLPYQRNPRYTRKALKTLAREFAADTTLHTGSAGQRGGYEFDDGAYDRWDDLIAVWRAVDDGNSEWDVPAYNGGLFAANPDMNPSGYAISQMRLSNAEIGPALRALLIDTSDDGHTGPVDFRALSVREFGSIYEGLLESSLSVAPTDLTVDTKTSAYLPAKAAADTVVEAGQVYFHNASGARKATGSYFTKSFAVEHLLDSALEPALTNHLTQVQDLLRAGDEAGAAEKFFDFRIADLSMGSGHFLVAAVDRIENRFAKFLTENPIAEVNDELSRLADAARQALGDQAAHVEVEPSMLLRRQIARRCIYGLDLNLMSVELARLAIWIHTFVPGLPMSSLEHGLRVGNSLTGIGTVEEALAVFEPRAAAGQYSLFAGQIDDALNVARDKLLRVARTAEATKAEVHQAALAYKEAMAEASEARTLLDAAIGLRLGLAGVPNDPSDALVTGSSPAVQEAVETLQAAHMPYLFPEVFLRENPGFDVILGNPPWEELVYEEIKFWTLHFPGLKSLSQQKQKAAMEQYRAERPDLTAEMEREKAAADAVRAVLMTGPYPGMGSGHADLYKAFCWRFLTLIRQEGLVGVVLPRGALSAKGSAEWRKAVMAAGSFDDVVNLVNNGQWVFDDVDVRYSIGLVTLRKHHQGEHVVTFKGPYRSLADFTINKGEAPATFPAAQFATWSNGAAFPMLPNTRAGEVFLKYRAHPRFDAPGGDWAFRPVQGDFNATTHRAYYDAAPEAPTSMPVYAGASINIWEPDTGERYGHADSTQVLPILLDRRVRQARTKSSAYYGMTPRDAREPATLAPMLPRIGFRDITNQTNTRTLITALLPPQVIAVNSLPFLVRVRGDETDEAYLLGLMSSIPMDWYARRYVELHVNFHILEAFPFPRPQRDDPLRQRVVHIAGRLAAVDSRYADWAAKVAVPVGSANEATTKADLINELDAVVAHLYGLNRSDVEHIFATFHRGWDYKARLDAVLSHYDQWKQQVDQQ